MQLPDDKRNRQKKQKKQAQESTKRASEVRRIYLGRNGAPGRRRDEGGGESEPRGGGTEGGGTTQEEPTRGNPENLKPPTSNPKHPNPQTEWQTPQTPNRKPPNPNPFFNPYVQTPWKNSIDYGDTVIRVENVFLGTWKKNPELFPPSAEK